MPRYHDEDQSGYSVTWPSPQRLDLLYRVPLAARAQARNETDDNRSGMGQCKGLLLSASMLVPYKIPGVEMKRAVVPFSQQERSLGWPCLR